MPVFAEKKENGVLVNICATRPEKRNTTLEIVQLKRLYYMKKYGTLRKNRNAKMK